MKSLLLASIMHFFISDIEIHEIRDQYSNAYTSLSSCNSFGATLKSVDDNSSTLIKGYKACFYFIKCKFIKNPFEKVKYFKKGKNLLDSAIEDNPKSVELIFLRYSIQKNLPSFLMYNSMDKDINFINENIKKINDKNLNDFIVNSLKSISK